MGKLSIVIPSRDEKFLTPTIDDIFRNARAEDTEVIAVLDSNVWPGDWKEVTDRHPRLHTIHHGSSRGMRAAINSGVASAKSRGAKYVMKLDGHCALDEGFDVKLLDTIEPNWIVIPRRKRLDADNWTLTDTHKPDVDYHYLSFPDDPNDFGGPGLNGKIWPGRAIARKDIPIDDEMASQGSAWLCAIDHFYELELMDEQSYGPFWNESQEILLKCWLSGGRGVINKNTWYAHLHKGSKHGRGYKLPESWLQQGATFTKNWIWNDAWDKQTKPFSWLIEHFWPVPTWPENWEELLYATRKPRVVGGQAGADLDGSVGVVGTRTDNGNAHGSTLVIHEADYGVPPEQWIDVRERLQLLVRNNSLDIVVNNSTLTPDANPFRGKKKTLKVVYSIDSDERITRRVEEKDWLIIGPVAQRRTVNEAERFIADTYDKVKLMRKDQALAEIDPGKEYDEVIAERSRLNNPTAGPLITSLRQLPPMTAAALNDYLIRKFSISPQRLRGPMPIELRDFHRNDLAQLFAELGFKRGAEIGVAEGNYSEVLLKANPECELLLVDPWHHYSDNPQGKSKEKHEYAESETKRKTAPYPNAKMHVGVSMEVVRSVEFESLDFVYLDANHSYPYIMSDLIEWTKRVRSGGIVALDDIYRLDVARWGAGPMEAIYDYTRAMRINPWWLISAHKSVDAFFVKL